MNGLTDTMPPELMSRVSSGGYIIIEPHLPLRRFVVSLHWSSRYESAPAHRWVRELVVRLFREAPAAARIN